MDTTFATLPQLLEQTQGTGGVDVYTHGEMLPANSYPAFKKYDNFVGNYGGSWWRQKEEFEKFNGPIFMTTNCIVPSIGILHKQDLHNWNSRLLMVLLTSMQVRMAARTSLP